MVHNGIITNSRVLRALLERKGYAFVSETDTESVAVLIQYIYDQQKLNGAEVTPCPCPSPQCRFLRPLAIPGHHASYFPPASCLRVSLALSARSPRSTHLHCPPDRAWAWQDAPDFITLVEETVSQLEGSFALVFKSAHFPNQLVATRRGSPLLVGIKRQPLRPVRQLRHHFGTISYAFLSALHPTHAVDMLYSVVPIGGGRCMLIGALRLRWMDNSR